jgi:hypothetical protein
VLDIVTEVAMTSAVAELDGILQSMLNLKPPGVSGSKITSVTSLCTANIQVCVHDATRFQPMLIFAV